MTLKPSLRFAAFSLVEVILAIGIVSFCLLALLGAFASGLESSRESEKDTFLSEMASVVINDWLATGSTAGTITGDGQIEAQGGVYDYAVGAVPFEDSEVKNVSANLRKVSITFRWPQGLDPQKQQSLVFYSSSLRSGTSSPAP